MSCYSEPINVVTLETPTKEEEKDIIHLIEYKERRYMTKSFCNMREDLVSIIDASNVSLWNRDADVGLSLPEYPVFRHPTAGMWIMSAAAKYYLEHRYGEDKYEDEDGGDRKEPRQYFFLVEIAKDRRIGSEFGVSTIHGAKHDIYTIIPLTAGQIKLFNEGMLDSSPAVKEYVKQIIKKRKQVELTPYVAEPLRPARNANARPAPYADAIDLVVRRADPFESDPFFMEVQARMARYHEASAPMRAEMQLEGMGANLYDHKQTWDQYDSSGLILVNGFTNGSGARNVTVRFSVVPRVGRGTYEIGPEKITWINETQCTVAFSGGKAEKVYLVVRVNGYMHRRKILKREFIRECHTRNINVRGMSTWESMVESARR